MKAARRAHGGHGGQRPSRTHWGPTLAVSLATLQVLLMLVPAGAMGTQQRQHLLRYLAAPSLQRRHTRRGLTAAV